MTKRDTTFLMVDNMFHAEQLSFFTDLNIVPESVIKEVLSSGSGEENCMQLIHFVYQKEPVPEKRIEFLKKAYRVSWSRSTGRGYGFSVGGTDYATWIEPAGMRIASGKRVCFADKGKLISWEEIDSNLMEMIKQGDYISKAEISETRFAFERLVADSLYFFLQDVVAEAKEKYVPFLIRTRNEAKTHAEFCETVYGLLKDKNSIDILIEEMNVFTEAFKKDPGLMRFNLYQPAYELWKLNLLAADSMIYIEKEEVNNHIPSFITDDEVINQFVSINPSNQKYQMYIDFTLCKNNTEKVKILQKMHGNGGGGGGSLGSYKFDSKGITLERKHLSESYSKETFSFTQVANLIDSVINDGLYLTEKDVNDYDKYVKAKLIRKAYFFFFDYKNRTHPEFDEAYASEDTLKAVIEDKEKCMQLIKVIDETLATIDKEHHRYESYQETLNNLKCYLSGTYLVIKGLPVISPS